MTQYLMQTPATPKVHLSPDEPFAATSGLKRCTKWKNASLNDVLRTYQDVADHQPVPSWVRDDGFCAIGKPSRWQCTPSGYRFGHRVHSSGACDVLREAGAQRVLFYGESTARHAFWGIVLLLTNGLLAPQPAGYPDDCEWAAEIGVSMRMGCRHELDNINVKVCDGAVELRFHQFFSPPRLPLIVELQEYDFVIWGWQGHAAHITRSYQRLGVNNATMLGESLQEHCRTNPRYASLASDRIILLNNHPRFSWQLMKTEGECPDAVAKYHSELPLVWRRECNVTRVASSWDAVLALVQTSGTDWWLTAPPGSAVGAINDTSLASSWWRKMTVDGVHWGTAINLMKADAIVEQISRRRRDTSHGTVPPIKRAVHG